jgi:iron-sulfur cluster assembly protein
MINVTETAAKEVRRIMETQNKKGWGLRVGVVGGGCSGLTYELKFEEQPGKDDLVYEHYGVRVFIDPKSFLYLNGLTVDYNLDMLNGGFKFVNPNATGGCGCGTSFKV